MKDKDLLIYISHFPTLHHTHWYVKDESCGRVLRKYTRFEDAWEYAKSIAYVKNIEVFD